MKRTVGILCPVASLPSTYGIGDFGKYSYEFIDLARDNGFTIWQVLPLNPLGYGHSPYQPFSSFALDELYVDFQELVDRKALKVLPKPFKQDSDKIYYEEIRDYKNPILKKAYKAEIKKVSVKKEVAAFEEGHPWVKAWSLFMMNKRLENLRSWSEWPERRKKMIDGTVTLTPEEEDLRLYEVWLQMTLYRQWDKLHKYAKDNGIAIMGDVPFYVGYDSSDVWGNQDTFLLDPVTKEPAWIAGVPPDYFSATGQRWGNPIYNWDLLKERHYDFIINRLKINGELYDIIRIDHFRAFDTYWKIPASCPTAIEGSWIEAPGYDFFDTFLKVCPDLQIVAEDLGDLRPEVLTLRDHYNFPGMNVVEFTFYDAAVLKTDHRDKENMIAYIGTHDNDTAKGYFEKLEQKVQWQWWDAMKAMGIDHPDMVTDLIEYTLSLKANYAIFAVQDLMGKESEARINVPGVIDDVNWTYRMKDFDELKAKLPSITPMFKKYNR